MSKGNGSEKFRSAFAASASRSPLPFRIYWSSLHSPSLGFVVVSVILLYIYLPCTFTAVGCCKGGMNMGPWAPLPWSIGPDTKACSPSCTFERPFPPPLSLSTSRLTVDLTKMWGRHGPYTQQRWLSSCSWWTAGIKMLLYLRQLADAWRSPSLLLCLVFLIGRK